MTIGKKADTTTKGKTRGLFTKYYGSIFMVMSKNEKGKGELWKISKL